ncbi:MAG: hypothetical protein ACTSQA_00975 [Candidatus Heimdallarchaeaceae archaeon]
MVTEIDPITGGLITVDPTGQGISTPESRARSRRRRSGGGVTTIEQPTPSAGDLVGTAREREEQIAAFRRGGQVALQLEASKATQRIQEQEQRTFEAVTEKQRRIDAGRVESQIPRIETPEQTATREARTALDRFEQEPRLTSISPRSIVDLQGERIIITREQAPIVRAQLFGGGIRQAVVPQTIITPQPIEGIPISEVQPAEKLGVTGRIERFGETVTQRKLTGRPVSGLARIGAFGGAVVAPIISFPVSTFRLGKGLVTEPITTVKAIPGGVREAGTRFFTQLGGPTPERAVGTLIGEGLILKGTGKIIGAAGKGLDVTRTRLSPVFKPVSEGKIKGVKLDSRTIDIPLVESATQVSTSLKQQARLAGTTQDIISAQTDLLGKVFQRQLTLDRTFFADPVGRLRIGRLKEPPPASLTDILSGDVTFRKPRSQSVIFEQETIAPLPSKLAKAFESGRPLTPSERKALIKFQETPTGQFKAIGFISREPEVTLPKGDIIQRKGGRAVTLIDNRRVEIVQAGVGKATGRTRKLLRKKELTSKEKLELEKRLSKESGFDISSSVGEGKPFVSPVKISSPFVSSRRISLPRAQPLGISGRVSGLSRKVKGLSITGASPLVDLGKISPTPRISSFVSPSVSPPPTFRPTIDVPFTTPRAPTIDLPSLDLTTPGPKPKLPGDRKLPKKKKKKAKKKPTRLAPSFTAQVLDLKGKFPTPSPVFGLTPRQIRVIPS